MRAIVIALAMTCAACKEAEERPFAFPVDNAADPSTQTVSEVPEQSVGQRLAAGDPSVCADPQVQSVLFKSILGGTDTTYATLTANGGSVALDAVSMTGKKQDIGELSCMGSIAPEGLAPHRVNFDVRPDAGDPSNFTVSWQIPPVINGIYRQSPKVAVRKLVDDESRRLGLYETKGSRATPNAPTTPGGSEDDSVVSNPRVQEWYKLNSQCRGSDDPTVAEKACAQRELVFEVLIEGGLCFGKASEPSAEHKWHKCGPGSI